MVQESARPLAVVDGHGVKGCGATSDGPWRRPQGALPGQDGEQYLVQRKAEKLLKQRIEGNDGGRAGAERLSWVRRRWQQCTKPPETVFKRALDGHSSCGRGEGRTGQEASRKEKYGERVRRRRQRVVERLELTAEHF